MLAKGMIDGLESPSFMSASSSVELVLIGIEVVPWTSEPGSFDVAWTDKVDEEVGLLANLSEHSSLNSTPCVLNVHFGAGFY